jgi:hypothetical protein
LPITTILSPPAALLEAKTTRPSRTSRLEGRQPKITARSWSETGEHGGRSLAPAEDVSVGEIDGDDFGERAAEVDENGDGGQGKTERSERGVRLLI